MSERNKRKDRSDDEEAEEAVGKCVKKGEQVNKAKEDDGDCQTTAKVDQADNENNDNQQVTNSSQDADGISEDEYEDDEGGTDNKTADGQPRKKFRIKGFEHCGTVLFCGGTNWDLIGRRELPKTAAKGAGGRNLWGPNRLKALSGVRVRSIAAGNSGCHCVIITDQGKVLTWGRNDKGQLGHGDSKRRDVPTVVETLNNHVAVAAACGRGHTLVLTNRGHVYSFGDNKVGQCGVGTQTSGVLMPSKITFKGRPVTKIACGAEFSMIIDVKGNLYSFGCPEYGQLGHNTDGRYFVTSNKLAYRCELVPRRVGLFVERTREGHIIPMEDVNIVDVACGNNHTIACDSKKRCYTWGFGGYGRLGHADPKDEMVPRLIKFFDGPNRGVRSVFAGGTFCMIISELGALYFWGQNKTAGEATMYPKPVLDLSGWAIRGVACSNRSIVVIADDTVISWGPSPTYGELGYGENKAKSSTSPQEVKALDSLYIYSVACGFGHTLFLARDDTEEDKAQLRKLPEFAP